MFKTNFMILGMDYIDPPKKKKKNSLVGKILLAATLTTLCILMLKQSPNFNPLPTLYV